MSLSIVAGIPMTFTPSRARSRAPPEGAVSADYDNGIELEYLCHTRGSFNALRRIKFLAPGGLQNRSAPADDFGYASEVHFKHFTVQKSLVAFSDPLYLKSSVNSGSYYGSDCGVHAGRIASGSKNTDSFYLHKMASRR